jgi:hypothetical protein
MPETADVRDDDPDYTDDVDSSTGPCIGRECIHPDPVHLRCECFTAEQAERFYAELEEPYTDLGGEAG